MVCSAQPHHIIVSHPYAMHSLLHPFPHDHARQLRAQARVNPGPLPHNCTYSQMKSMGKAQLIAMYIVILHHLNCIHALLHLPRPLESHNQHRVPYDGIRLGAPLILVRLAWRFKRCIPIRSRPRDSAAAQSTCSHRGVRNALHTSSVPVPPRCSWGISSIDMYLYNPIVLRSTGLAVPQGCSCCQ
jgi:hypothetical protein